MPASSRRALIGALASNLAIAITKFVVGGLTRSTVMIAEGIHSLVDTGNSALMLMGESRSRRPPDEEHPFGYGMELYFWSFVVAMVVFAGGGGISVYEGIRAALHPHGVTRLWLNYAVIGAASIFEGASLAVGLREFAVYRRERSFVGSALAVMRASKNPAIFMTVLEDSAALVGLAVAAAGLTLSHFFGQPLFDAAATIVIGAVLMLEAGLLGFECRGLLIGEAARPIVIAQIREVVARVERLGDVTDVRTLQLGPDAVMVVLGLAPPPAILAGELMGLVQRVAQELRDKNPVIKDVVIELGSSKSLATSPQLRAEREEGGMGAEKEHLGPGPAR